MSDLVICKLSHASAPAIGGTEMILLCEKVAKGLLFDAMHYTSPLIYLKKNYLQGLFLKFAEDIQVRFFEERDNEVKWEAYANFQPSQVHKQVAITFETPRYERIEVGQSFKV